MAEYIDREKLIPDRCYYEPDRYEAVSCDQIFHDEVADVIEKEKIKEILDGYDGSMPSMIICFSKIQKLVESEITDYEKDDN